MLDRIVIFSIFFMVFFVGWTVRGVHDDNKKTKSRCGTVTITPTDVPGIYETRVSLNDIARLYNSHEAIFTVVHTQNTQGLL